MLGSGGVGSNGLLDQFELPEIARETLEAKFSAKPTGVNGAEMFMAHDSGVALRFFHHQEYSKQLSKQLKYEKFVSVPMIEWFVDADTKICERVHFLPDELLCFERIVTDVLRSDGKENIEKTTFGECIGGKLKESYDRFLKGVNSPGMPISKWGVLGDSECATLAAAGIFSVEQLAAQPRSKIVGKYPQEFVEAFERAIQYVAGKIARDDSEKNASEILKLQNENQKKDNALKLMQDQILEMQTLLAGSSAKKGKKKPGRPPGRPRKVIVSEEGEIVDQAETTDENA